MLTRTRSMDCWKPWRTWKKWKSKSVSVGKSPISNSSSVQIWNIFLSIVRLAVIPELISSRKCSWIFNFFTMNTAVTQDRSHFSKHCWADWSSWKAFIWLLIIHMIKSFSRISFCRAFRSMEKNWRKFLLFSSRSTVIFQVLQSRKDQDRGGQPKLVFGPQLGNFA